MTDKPTAALTKEQILTATEEALRRYGPEKTSVTDVAKALQVSHGTLYRHYKSKGDLMEGVTAKWLDEKIIEPLTAIVTEPKSDSNRTERIKRYLTTLVELKRQYAREDEEMFAMYAKVTEEATALLEYHIKQMINQLQHIITEDGIQTADSKRLATSLFDATARFHHPAHAKEWRSERIHNDFIAVLQLLEAGIHQTNNH
ncbi:TetR/AcrR family transcriptional regulator [Paenibacillaceae bacterium]|nr:TetR/AcrR family transcriptional regulator [Paenibacillaceae bacterium]